MVIYFFSFFSVTQNEEGEVDLPEGMLHVTGNVFELEWFAVKDAKLLS